MQLRFAHGPETIRLGDREVRRLGFGAMRLAGTDVEGEPSDPATAHAVLRRAIELGVNFIDTAGHYGPLVANRLICEALRPYTSDLVIATTVGATRADNGSWEVALRPEQLRVAIDDDLRTLGLEQLAVVHLRYSPQEDVSFATALDALIDVQKSGKVRHIALANVSVEQLDEALAKTPVACVQHTYVVGANDAGVEALLTACEQRAIPFIPYAPPGSTAGSRASEATAKRLGCTASQLAIAWLLARSRVMLPIPGTSRVTHLEENIGAVHVAIDEATFAELAH